MRNITFIRKFLLSLLFIVIVSYSIFQAQKLIRGPVIKIISPKTGATFSQSLIEIEGVAKNVAYLNLDDRPIFTDKNGYFREKFLLSPGYNVIKIDGKDKFKKSTQKTLEIILKEY